MKNSLLLSLFCIVIYLAGFMLLADSKVMIQWLDWDIKIDAFLLFTVWLLTFFFFVLIINILKTPGKIKKLLQRRKIGKSTSLFNKALLQYLNDDFNDAFESFALIKEKENYFESQLMSAASLMNSGDIRKTTAILRKLIRQYPKQSPLLQCLLGKWQLQNKEYHLAYETLANEIKEGSPMPHKWFLFMQATDHTSRLDEWQILLPSAKKELSRQDFKKLQDKLYQLQIRYAENESDLNHVWHNINHATRNIPIIAKTYLDRCNQLSVENKDNYRQMKNILKQEWRSEWLWDMVNYPQYKDYHSLLDWCKDIVQQENHVEDSTYFLSLSVIACRAKLWAISEDFLIQAKKSSIHKSEHDEVIITLIKGWIHSQVEQTAISSQWIKLMKQHGMIWLTQES